MTLETWRTIYGAAGLVFGILASSSPPINTTLRKTLLLPGTMRRRRHRAQGAHQPSPSNIATTQGAKSPAMNAGRDAINNQTIIESGGIMAGSIGTVISVAKADIYTATPSNDLPAPTIDFKSRLSAA